jgi:hypothetical protein
VRGLIHGDSRPLDRLITRCDLAEINGAAADATLGAAIKPVPVSGAAVATHRRGL